MRPPFDWTVRAAKLSDDHEDTLSVLAEIRAGEVCAGEIVRRSQGYVVRLPLTTRASRLARIVSSRSLRHRVDRLKFQTKLSKIDRGEASPKGTDPGP